MLEENRMNKRTITAIIKSHPAYQGYQRAPTGSAPNRIATAPMIIL